MDVDHLQRFNPHRTPLINRRRRAWGPETSGGHHLSDPSPPAASLSESKH